MMHHASQDTSPDHITGHLISSSSTSSKPPEDLEYIIAECWGHPRTGDVRHAVCSSRFQFPAQPGVPRKGPQWP